MSTADLTRDEMVRLVRRLCAGEGSKTEIERMLKLLKAAKPHVPWTQFIYWPTGFPHNPAAHQPTPEEIVDKALAYQPRVIVTPPPSNS